jgi:anti-sigma factor ChrR (cupin superfamily)
MLTRFYPGGFFPLHGHPGGEEILVFEGNFVDETGVGRRAKKDRLNACLKNKTNSLSADHK